MTIREDIAGTHREVELAFRNAHATCMALGIPFRERANVVTNELLVSTPEFDEIERFLDETAPDRADDANESERNDFSNAEDETRHLGEEHAYDNF